MITDSEGWALACPKCGSAQLTKNGTTTTSNGDKKQKYKCGQCQYVGSNVEYADPEVIEGAIKLAKDKQRLQDNQRTERKLFREDARVLNLHEDINNSLIKVLTSHKFKNTSPVKPKKDKAAGICHFSDIHFNELIDMPYNQYNFRVASQRIQKYITKCKQGFKADDVGRVIVEFGGDLLNSDRRIDEITAACTNRTQAMVLAVDILSQAVKDLASEYHVDVFWVCGNEGRVNKELGFNDFVASDNYDHAIPMMMAHLFKDYDGVYFHMPTNAMECVINVNGKNILLIHGHGGGGGVPSKKAAGLRAKYAERGVIIDFIMWGHIHEAYISELFARSGSPAGGNAFSDNALGLGGKASQNYYIVSKLGEISGRVIPLQEYSEYPGYDFDESLVSYNSKSMNKTQKKQAIFEIVV